MGSLFFWLWKNILKIHFLRKMNRFYLRKDQLTLETSLMTNFLKIKMKLIFVGKKKQNFEKLMINYFYN